MNDASYKLNFELPQRVKPQRDDRFGSTRLFQSWLETVPLANTSAAGNALLGALEEMNESDVPAKFRFQILERLLEPVLTVVFALDKHYSDTSFPISEKAEKVGRVSVHFFIEYAKAYRIAADQLSNSSGRVNIINAKMCGTCIQRALSAIEQGYLRNCLLYRQPTESMWREANQLYGFASNNRLLDKPVADGFRIGNPGTSIRNTYHRILIMAVSDPCRLSQRATKLLFEVCPLWAERVQVSSQGKKGAFLLGGHTADAPKLVSEGAQIVPNRQYFDLDPLKSWLERQMSANADADVIRFNRDNEKPVLVEQAFIRQFVSNWGHVKERSFERMAATHQIKMVVGLNAMHYLAAENLDFERFIQESGDREFVDAAKATNSWGGDSETRRRPSVFDTGVLNQSLGGYRLSLNRSEQVQLRVGELVGLCPAALIEDEPCWMVAIIRWLHSEEGENMQLGVRIIGRAVKPACLLPDVGTGDSKMPPFRGLVVTPFDSTIQKSDFIVVPGFFNQSDQVLKIYFNDHLESFSGEVSLDELIERSTEVSSYELNSIQLTAS